MKALILDISTSTGFALLEGEQNGPLPKLLKYGTIVNPKKISEYGPYPFSYLAAAYDMARKLVALYFEHAPDVIVVEETNGSRSRYTQKALEFLHCAFLQLAAEQDLPTPVYVNTSDWRKAVGARLTTEDKKQNAKLSKAKSKANKAGEKLDKKALGIKGKINKKHVAIRWVNENYGMAFKAKDDDVCDAICMGVGFYMGIPHCDGKK